MEISPLEQVLQRKDVPPDVKQLITEFLNEYKNLNRQLKKTTEDLRLSRSELEQFTSLVSHDLREPLNAITGFLQLLEKRRGETLDSETKEYISFAINGALRMNTQIEDLVTLSRINLSSTPLEQIDMSEVLRKSLWYLQAAIDDSGSQITHEQLPKVKGDDIQLTQLFQNLIGNAIKFCGEKKPHIHISYEKSKIEWLFSVSDKGIGIEKKYFDRIFKVFQRLHTREEYPGTGVGLSICKKIVDRHGGKIWVESEIGKGSTFFFSIPR